MYQERILYNSDGEKVKTDTTYFTGRFNDDKGYALYAYGNTISSRIGVDFPPGMNKNDIANMVLLSRKLIPNTNMLGYRGHKRNKPMNTVQIGEVIGLQERQAYRFMKKMVSVGMIKRINAPIMGGHELQYIVNPLYFMNGKFINDELFTTFNDELTIHLPKWVQDKFKLNRDKLE